MQLSYIRISEKSSYLETHNGTYYGEYTSKLRGKLIKYLKRNAISSYMTNAFIAFIIDNLDLTVIKNFFNKETFELKTSPSWFYRNNYHIINLKPHWLWFNMDQLDNNFTTIINTSLGEVHHVEGKPDLLALDCWLNTQQLAYMSRITDCENDDYHRTFLINVDEQDLIDFKIQLGIREVVELEFHI